jgi:DNA-binding SARP family transcriptional activator
MTDQMRVTVLGGVRISCGDEPLTGFISAKAQALVCYLAVTQRPHARATLAALFWQDLSESAAATNLRVVLANLKRLLGPSLEITRHTLGINPLNAPWVDAAAFCELADPIQTDPLLLQRADTLYDGDFLAGFDVRNAPAFDEWVLGQREMLRERAIRMLRLLAIHHAERGDYDLAADYLQRLLEIEPWLEEAHRALMVTLTAGGRRGAALRQYERCRQLLSDELDVVPLAQTTQLYQAIRHGETLGAGWERPALAALARPQADLSLIG